MLLNLHNKKLPQCHLVTEVLRQYILPSNSSVQPKKYKGWEESVAKAIALKE